MEGKTPAVTAIHDHTYRIFPNDLNAQGTVFGGLIMAEADRLAHIVAERHSSRICVTASVDSIVFHAPAGHGDNLIFQTSINRSWHSSMEVGVKVTAEERLTLERKHIASAYLTFVALNDHGKPVSVPPVLPESEEEKRRFNEADLRRKNRISLKKQKLELS
ncbi:MAG: acyl-CoA thioesterase [Simkaniaceae bacterium]|jgi:acyl-CoA hydrolase